MAIDAEAREASPLTGTMLGARFCGLVRERPFAAIGAAALTGATLGGLVFTRLGRFVFLAATAYVATDLWRREGSTGPGDLFARVSGALRSHAATRSTHPSQRPQPPDVKQ